MRKDEILKSLKEFSQKPIFPKILISVGLVIMVMIVFADFSGSKDKKSVSDTDADFQTADTYIECTENRLSEVLMSIEGVGKAKVLVNVSSTEEYVYAEEFKQGSISTENEIVIIDSGSSKEALIKKVKIPEISGIVIVCEGGDDPKVCEKVYKAVSTALKIPSSRIYVAEMK